MIEPDINEQMSNFAPSQNAEDLLRSAAPQEGLSMTEAIMPRASMPLPAAPKQPMLDPGLQAAVDEMASQRSAVMNASLYNASKKNPDTAGEAQRLAQQMGVGADIAERNLEEMRRGAAMVRALDRNLATSAPRTANALTEPDFANIAFDDLENLTGAEKLMRWYAGTDFFKGAQGTFIQTEMSIIDQLNSEGMATPQDFERYKELQRDLQIVGSPKEGSWTGSFANILASVGAGLPDAAEYAVIGANVGGVAGVIGGPFAPATVPAGLMLGASAGFATGMAKWMYQAMAGESYRQLREAEVPHDVAVPVSRGVGVITSALEFAGLGAEVWIASGVGKKLFAKEVATEVNAKLLQELTRRATLRGAVYEGAKLYVGEMLAESTVEATQTLITRVGTELARSYSRPDLQNMMQTPEGRRKIIGEAVDAFVTTAKGMALMGAPLPAVNFYIDRSRAADAQRSQKFYEDLSKNAVDSKVRQRNPDAAERHFASVMDGTGAETTYVNAHVMQNILNQAGVTAEQVDSVLPGLSRQLADALAQGGDVTMPTATWAAKLAGTKLGDAMKPHMRPNAQAWSADTAAKYQAEVEQRKAEALAIEAEKETTDSTFVDEARAVEKEALAQLEAAGQDKKLAKLNARIYRDMVVVMAANPNRNQTPAQVHAEIGPDIFGPQGMQEAAAAAPLEQADQFDKAGQRRTDTAEFREWSRNAPIFEADEPGFTTGTPMVVKAHHGTNKTFVQFKMDRPAWFAARPGTAGEFVAGGRRKMGEKPSRGSQIIPVYLAFQNPLDLRYNVGGETTVNPQSQVSMVDVLKAASLPSDKQALRKIAERNLASGFAGVAANIEDKAGYLAAKYANKNKLWSILDDQGLIDTLKESGFDGLILTEGGNIFAALNANDIKSVNNRGTWSRATTNIMEQVAISRVDADYLAAVERGDMDAAQRMVDQAAMASGYKIPVYHFTKSEQPFTSFDIEQMQSGPGIWLTSSPEGWYGRRMDLYLNPGKIENVKSQFDPTWNEGELSIEGIINGDLETISQQNINTLRNTEDYRSTFYVATRPEQVKSADPVTYDEQGNIVPLSRRFDITSAKLFEQAAAGPAFYSALEREIAAIDSKTLSAAGWNERLKGLVNKGAIKADELEWSGLNDYLKMQEGKVSKDTVLEFLRGNGVKVEIIIGGDAGNELDVAEQRGINRAENVLREYGMWTEDMAKVFAEYRAMMPFRDGNYDSDKRQELFIKIDDALNQANGTGIDYYIESEYDQVSSDTGRYEQYTLPGGTNYREVLLTLPSIPNAPELSGTIEALPNGRFRVDYPGTRSFVFDTREDAESDLAEMQRAMGEKPRGVFRSKHWSQQNVLVHLRLNDRVDADGKRVLFVEEVQSDWGQAGVKRGFVNQRAADEAELADLLQQQEATPTDARKKQIARVQERLTKDEYNISRAPYVETTDGWLNLGLKQIMLEAVRSGYERVAFVTGQQSANRYDLSRQVESIVFNKNMDGTFDYQVTLLDTESDELDGSGKTIEQIEETFGKEIAQKMDAATPTDTAEATDQEEMFPNELSGLDLKVGGEGMQNFYDKIVPAAMGKLLKKYGGGKLGNVVLPNMRQQEMEADAERMGMNVADVLDLAKDTEYAQAQPGFNITPELVKKLESGLPLFQAMPERNEPRGQYDANRIAILLNTKASATTFFHELIHWRMDMAIRMVNQGKASAQEAADVDTLFKSFGIAGDTPQERLATWNKMSIEQQRPHWETVAYNSEIYLFEGKAPSVEMQGVFDRLHAFVKRVYVSIKTELNALYRKEFGKDLPILTGEVREVMDRWLASEEQIQRKQAMMQMVPLFLTQEESGMDDATWAQHQQASKEAEEAAVTDLTKASLRQMEWLSGARSRILKKLQSMHDDLRKKTRAEVMEEVKNEPVYAAMSILKTGEGRAKNGELVKFNDKFKLNLEMVKKMLPEEQVRQLGYGKYGMVAEDGIAPDMVAEMVGFSSGDELVLAILAAKPLKEEVDARTDRRMMEEHGELNTPQAMEEAVQRALHNEARARFNAVYVRFLSKSTAPVQAFMDATKLAARQIISGKVIRDLRPGDHQAAEAKAAREAAEAYKSRRTAEQAAKAAETKERNVGLSAAAAGVPMALVDAAAAAKGQEAAQRVAEREAEYKAKYGDRTPEQVMLRAKQIQLLQNQLAREAQEAKDEVANAVKDFRKFFKADDKLAKTRNMDLVDAARAILSAFGFGKSDKSPAEYIEKLKAYNPVMYAGIEPLVMAAISGSKNYKDLTVEQFRQLREVVDALWEQSSRDKFVEIDGKMVALSDVVGQLETRLDEIGVPKVVAGERGAPTTKDRAVRGFYDVKAVMRRVEHWADATDGAKGVGPFTKYIWRPIKDAVNAYRIDRNKYVKKYVELLKQVVLPEGKIESKELDYTFGNANGGIGKAELLGALMHTGNDSNKKKLLVGRGWGSINEDGTLDSSRWDAFVARMIKQGVLTKSDFDFVQATWDLLEEVKPIAQKAHRSIFGFYFKEIEATPFTNEFGTFRGGYVPAKTDAFIVRDAQRQSKMEELEGDFRNSMPSIGMGFTKGRVEYNKPLSMDVRLVVKHIDDVLRFAHVQPAIKDVLRILKNRGFSDKLSRIDPTVVEDMLIPWLNRAARQVTSEPGRNKGMDKFWKTVRSRTGISIMAANLRNAMQQVTGLFPSALKVSKTQLGNALMTYLGSPLKTANEVASLSTFMNERMQSQIFDMQDDINEILLNPNAYNKVVKWTQKHSYFLQSAFQNMVDVVTWTGKYNQVLAESKVGASDTKVQREAIQQADAAVRLTQGSMSAEDISAFEVGTPFYKTFNQFGGYFNMLANLNADEYIKVIRDLGWRGNKGKLLNIYILGFVAPTLVADAIARSMGGGWDDDDDGYLDDVMDWFFGSQARAAVAMVPFGSTAATAITTAFDSKAYNDRISASPSIVALEASTIGVGKTIINIADDDKEVEGKNVRDVMTLISLATGTPVTVLGRPVGYLVDVNRKKIKPTGPIDVARGLVTGVASGESKKK